jgi:DNA-binding transcriptional regulator YiaG
MDVDEWGVTAEERAEARRYGMAIDWSDEDQVFIASIPGLAFAKIHGATREEAAAMGDDLIITVLTAYHDSGREPPPPLTARTAIVAEPPVYDAERVRQVRRRLNVSQAVFAKLLNVGLATVRCWEQGTRVPDGAARRLLAIAELYPSLIAGAAADPQAEVAPGAPVLQVRSTQPRRTRVRASA